MKQQKILDYRCILCSKCIRPSRVSIDASLDERPHYRLMEKRVGTRVMMAAPPYHITVAGRQKHGWPLQYSRSRLDTIASQARAAPRLDFASNGYWLPSLAGFPRCSYCRGSGAHIDVKVTYVLPYSQSYYGIRPRRVVQSRRLFFFSPVDGYTLKPHRTPIATARRDYMMIFRAGDIKGAPHTYASWRKEKLYFTPTDHYHYWSYFILSPICAHVLYHHAIVHTEIYYWPYRHWWHHLRVWVSLIWLQRYCWVPAFYWLLVTRPFMVIAICTLTIVLPALLHAIQ